MAEIRAELGVGQIDLAHEQAVARRLAQRGQAVAMSGALREWTWSSVACSGCSGSGGGPWRGGSSRSSGSFMSRSSASRRKPSTPRPSQKRMTSAWPRRPRGCASRGRAAPDRRSAGTSRGRRGSRDQAEPPKAATPVVRRLRCVADDVEVGVLAEPGVLDRRVAGHEVHEHAQAQPLGLGQQGVEVVEGPEARVDGVKSADVVAEVVARARVERRQPHRLRAQRGHVREPLHGAAQVAEAVAVAVLKRARVDLVDGCSLPPHGE